MPLFSGLGLPDLVLAYGLAGIPTLAGLIHGRAQVHKYLLSPFLAAFLTGVAAFIAWGLRAPIQELTGSLSDETALYAGAALFAFVGYVGGRIAARTEPAEVHRRGTVVIDSQQQQRSSSSAAAAAPGI